MLRVAAIYSEHPDELDIKSGTVFTPNLSNAPEKLRELAHSGIFVRTLGTEGIGKNPLPHLDVTKRYDQIPNTE